VILFSTTRAADAGRTSSDCGSRLLRVGLVGTLVVQVVDVPRNALLRNFMMFAQKFQGEGTGGWIVLLVGKVRCLNAGFVLQPKPPIEDGEVVVRGQVIGVNALNLLVFRAGEVIFVLLVEREAELAMGVA